MFCILNYFTFVEFSANLIYSLLVLEIIWSLQDPSLKGLGEGQFEVRFSPPPFFFQQLMTWELFVHSVLPSCAAVRSTPFQSTCFLVLHNLSLHRGGNCFNLSLEKALLPTMRKILNDHFTQYLQYVLIWLLIWKLNKQYPG